MGFKKESYKIDKLNIEIQPAYAIVGRMEIENNSVIAEIKIHKTRQDLEEYEPLESIYVTCGLDRKKPIYEQIYNEARKGPFKDWQDDILV